MSSPSTATAVADRIEIRQHRHALHDHPRHCGIDMVAGPTEILILADHTADAFLVATDLLSQAEHGPTSPAWLVTSSQKLADEVNKLVPELIHKWLDGDDGGAADVGTGGVGGAGNPALTAWENFGEIVVVQDRHAICAVSDAYAAEHTEVHCADLDWFLKELRNYGSLFLGEETCVT